MKIQKMELSLINTDAAAAGAAASAVALGFTTVFTVV